MKKIRAAIVGYGNIGHYVLDALEARTALYGGGNAGLCRPYPCQSGAHGRSGVCGASHLRR